jgi:hypothetical protein
MKKLLLAVLFVSLCQYTIAQTNYPDKNIPTDIPQFFAKGILSDGLSNRDLTISPDGNELFFTIQHPQFAASVIIRLVKVNGVWSKPEVAPFSGKYRDLEASFTPDGKTLYFASDRPITANTVKKDFDIWRVSKSANGKWGEPENLGTVVNSDKNEFYPIVTTSGNLYFTAEAPYGKGSEDIVMCAPTAKGYSAPVSLPEAINTKFGEFNAYVSADEQLIMFSSFGRADDMGGGDIYISKKDKNGNWVPARHLPAPINSTGLDYCPYLTPDKKYLVFTSNRSGGAWKHDKAFTYAELKTLLTQAGNGLDDIYWLKFKFDW